MKLPSAKQNTMMSAQIGTGPMDHRAKIPKSELNPAMGRPPDIRYAIPWNTVCDANVAISAGIPIVATIPPLITPIAVAISNVISTAGHMFIPALTIRNAQTTLTSVIIEPIDRSIPAIRMTKVIPIEAIP